MGLSKIRYKFPQKIIRVWRKPRCQWLSVFQYASYHICHLSRLSNINFEAQGRPSVVINL